MVYVCPENEKKMTTAAPASAKSPKKSEIWAVGGGRGATGKSLVAAGLGTTLALAGRRIILVDMDTGGTGMSALFGYNLPARTIADFFETGTFLADLAVPTAIPSLSLIPGDIPGLAAEGIAASARQRFLRQMAGLEARTIIVDAGTGSRDLGLDAFLAAGRMIVVLSPEGPAVENVYRFVKAAMFRRIHNSLNKFGLKEIVPRLWQRRDRYGIRNIKDLIDYIKDAYPHFGTVLDRDLRPFHLDLVVNMVRSETDRRLGAAARSALVKYLGIPVRLAGFIGEDEAIRPAVREGKPITDDIFSPGTVRDFQILADRLARGADLAEPGGPSGVAGCFGRAD